MSNSSSISSDASGNKFEEIDIYDSTDSFVRYMENLKKSIHYIRNRFRALHDGYLEALETEKSTTSQQKKESVKNQYETVNKQLYRFIKVFMKDYADALDKSIEITKLREEYNLLVRQNHAGMFDGDDMYQLERTFNRLVKRHNRLATQFNEEAQRFNLLQNFLQKEIIFYAPKEEKSFEINLNTELKRFKRLVGLDVIGAKLTKIYRDFRVFAADYLKKSANTKKLTDVPPLSSFGDRSVPPIVRLEPKVLKQVPTASNSTTTTKTTTNRKQLDREEDQVSSSDLEQQNDSEISDLKSYQKISESWKLQKRASPKLKNALNDQIMHPHVQLYLLVLENGPTYPLNSEKGQLSTKKFEFDAILDYILDNDLTKLDEAFQAYLTSKKSVQEDEPENEDLKPIFYVLHILSDECRVTFEMIDILFNLELKLNEKQQVEPLKQQSNINVLLRKIESKLEKPFFPTLTGILRDEEEQSSILWKETQFVSTQFDEDKKFEEFLDRYSYLLEMNWKEIKDSIDYGRDAQRDLYGDIEIDLESILRTSFRSDKQKVALEKEYLEEQLKLIPIQYYYLHHARNSFIKIQDEEKPLTREEYFELGKKVRIHTLAIQKITLIYGMTWEKILKLGGKPVDYRDFSKKKQTRNFIIRRGAQTLLREIFLEISEIQCEISDMIIEKINSDDEVKENKLSGNIKRKEKEWNKLMEIFREHIKIYNAHPVKNK
ncbi:uncharacterized protein LOC141525510 [Cotesia typhae]|uniref:uncharacterized protein LOC141525510 n=1 Tax=Cotesia typhae TaxID=2053667 RepID=UPI003D6964E3